jgi:hypothetical protein
MNDMHLLDMPPDKMEGEVVAALFFKDDRPLAGAAALLDWRLNGHLTKQLLSGSVTGTSRDLLLVQNNGKLDSDWALFVGGGRRKEISVDQYSLLLAKIFRTCHQAGFARIAICLDIDSSLSKKELTTLVREAYNAGPYTGIDYLLTLVPVAYDTTRQISENN